jgi:manganese transport protein
MAPAFLVVGLGLNATDSLVASQVILSLALPIPMIALLILTNDPAVMGPFANTRALRHTAAAAATLILALNILLILTALGVELPMTW